MTSTDSNDAVKAGQSLRRAETLLDGWADQIRDTHPQVSGEAQQLAQDCIKVRIRVEELVGRFGTTPPRSG